MISAAYAGGSVLAGLGLVGRRPLVAAVIGTFGYAVPCLVLALHAAVYAVVAGALVAGVGSGLNGTLTTSVEQQRIPQQMLATGRGTVEGRG